MIKKYLVSYYNKASITVEMDHSKLPDSKLCAMNLLWEGAEERLASQCGDPIDTILKFLAKTVLKLQLIYGDDVNRIVSLFDRNELRPPRGVRGWPSMDGKEGFKIIAITPLEIPLTDFLVQDVISDTCDHDWEDIGNGKMQCTYPECLKVKLQE